ncbi:MAG: hypothetical protein K2J15_05085 [Muribaculaceae bacterium]|nr:hypothetical protein [Muribaculaceae bacterium]
MGRIWTGNTRAPWHDYTQRQIYHITLRKRPEVPYFGSLAGDWRLPAGAYGRSYIKASPLGSIIKACIKEISTIDPAIRIYQYSLMPDHLHLLLAVEAPLDEILGRKLAAFKVMVNKRANLETVFERGFNDQILTTSRNLNVIYSYLRDNPYRLAVRFANPNFFSRINQIEVGGNVYSAYGNRHLLSNPFKEQVVIHRADNNVKRKSDRERWLYTAANGGVLVSPFISKSEKSVRSESEILGGKLILVTNESFPERYKPAAHDFDLCVAGRLLIVSIGRPAGMGLTRADCLRMNSLAREIASL